MAVNTQKLLALPPAKKGGSKAGKGYYKSKR